jgi:hypothetical protein
MSSEETAIDPEVLPAETKGKRKALAKRETPTDLLSVIAQAVVDPRMDVAKMERLLAMHERISAEQKKTAYMDAMSRLQAKLPQIEKSGRIEVKGALRSKYAKIEDIDVVIRPLLAEEGFSCSFNEESTDGKAFRISCTMSHREGHTDTKTITLPLDASDYRSSVQSRGSTQSYGRRQLLKMHLNLIEKDEDTDGNDQGTITDEQARDIRTMLTDTKSDEAKFLALIAGVDKIESIPARDFKRCINALEQKARTQK